MRENQGNVALAVPVKRKQAPVKAAKSLKKAYLTVGEKLLYLFSVVICVLLASIVLSKYAKVAELNVSIHQVTTQIDQTKKVNLQLETEKKKLGSVERVRKFAEDRGLQLKGSKMLPAIRP